MWATTFTFLGESYASAFLPACVPPRHGHRADEHPATHPLSANTDTRIFRRRVPLEKCPLVGSALSCGTRAPQRHGTGATDRGEKPALICLTSASSEDQPLLSMNHSWFKQANCGAEIRTLEAELSCCSNTLRASADGDVYVWDHFRRPEKRPATVEGEEAGAGGGTVAQRPSDEEGKIAVANQIPRWNEVH